MCGFSLENPTLISNESGTDRKRRHTDVASGAYNLLVELRLCQTSYHVTLSLQLFGRQYQLTKTGHVLRVDSVYGLIDKGKALGNGAVQRWRSRRHLESVNRNKVDVVLRKNDFLDRWSFSLLLGPQRWVASGAIWKPFIVIPR